MSAGSFPHARSTAAMCVMSSRFTIAPSSTAFRNSASGVSLDVNMTSSPTLPTASARTSSAMEEQSLPKPSSRRIFIRWGFGVAFTAKYSRKPLFHANAFLSRFAFARMASAS